MSETIDPTASTDPNVSRRTFVGVSAAAAAAAVQTAHAIADDTLGKTHPPLVSEDDPAIHCGWGNVESGDAVIRAYWAHPLETDAKTPSVVVIQHIWGVDTSIRDVVRRYAKSGYAASAPDLFSRFGAPSGDGVTDVSVFRPFAKQLTRAQYGGDIKATAVDLSRTFPQTKTAITGFCMGGHIVLQQTIDNAGVFYCAAPFYGAVEGIDPASVGMPVCGSYGGRDTSIPAAAVLAFFNALKPPHDVKVYPEAGHAFFDDQRASYVPSAAADAWQRTLAFFHGTLS